MKILSMKPHRRGNRDLIKAMNSSLLLNIVRRSGMMSRTQLTEISGLSVGAVSQLVNDLLREGWLLEIGEGEYTGGRRQMMLRLNPQAGYAVGLKLMETSVACAITDFESRVLRYQEHPLDTDYTPQTVCEQLAAVIQQTIADLRLNPQQCLGVGIGVAGVIHPQQGIVHYSPFFGWQDVPLADLMTASVHFPIYVENDVNTLTLHEMLFGSGRHQSNFVVITIGRGIGMGIVVNGQLYTGARGGAGEIGHIMLPTGSNGNRMATLESIAADPAVIDAVMQGRNTHGRRLTMSDVVALANHRDREAQTALAHSGEMIGLGIAMVVNILCPNLIIISGEGIAAGELRLTPMLESLHRHTFNGLLDDVQVSVQPMEQQAWARGAAMLAISKVFESPLLAVGT